MFLSETQTHRLSLLCIYWLLLPYLCRSRRMLSPEQELSGRLESGSCWGIEPCCEPRSHPPWLTQFPPTTGVFQLFYELKNQKIKFKTRSERNFKFASNFRKIFKNSWLTKNKIHKKKFQRIASCKLASWSKPGSGSQWHSC